MSDAAPTSWTPPEQIEVALLSPVQHRGVRYEKLTLRKPCNASLGITAFAALSQMAPSQGTELQIRLIALFARMPVEAVDELGVVDAQNLFRCIGQFFGPAEEAENA